MKETISIFIWAALLLAIILALSFLSQRLFGADKPPQKVCRFLICEKLATKLSDCTETKARDEATADALIDRLKTRRGFFRCGTDDGEYQIERVIFEAVTFGGVG